MPPALVFLLGLFALIIVVVIVSWRKERERTEALRRVAETAGLAFEPKAGIAAVRSLGDVQLFARGHSKRVTNLMTGRLGDQAEAFGYQDIDIESSPEFSRRYIVRGADEAAIRAALYPRATSYFAEHEGWTVEAQSGTVGIYRADSRPKPGDMRNVHRGRLRCRSQPVTRLGSL